MTFPRILSVAALLVALPLAAFADGEVQVHRAAMQLGDAEVFEDHGMVILEISASVPAGREGDFYFEVLKAGGDDFYLSSGDFTEAGADGTFTEQATWSLEPDDCGQALAVKVRVVDAGLDVEEATVVHERTLSIDVPSEYCANIEWDTFE